MATKKWNSIDNYSNDATEYYCAFLDILGYKNKAEQFFKNEFNLHGRFGRAMQDSIANFNSTSHLIDTSGLEVKFFSDSIIILLPTQNGSSDQIFGFIQFCAILSAHLSFEDLLVRGGIAKGFHKEVIDPVGFSFIASLALQKAYLLEKEKAIYPRILVETELINEFKTASLEIRNYLAQERDDYFVHYAGHIINNRGENEKDVLMEMSDLKRKMDSEIDDRVKNKYSWLLDYYHWVLSNTSNIDIKKFSQFHSGCDHGFSFLSL